MQRLPQSGKCVNKANYCVDRWWDAGRNKDGCYTRGRWLDGCYEAHKTTAVIVGSYSSIYCCIHDYVKLNDVNGDDLLFSLVCFCHLYKCCCGINVFQYLFWEAHLFSSSSAFPYLGSAASSFHSLWSCASSLCTPVSFMSLLIASLYLSFGLPSFSVHPLPYMS